jgi:hypothetical protein
LKRKVTVHCHNCGDKIYEVSEYAVGLHCRGCGIYRDIPAPSLLFKLGKLWHRLFPRKSIQTRGRDTRPSLAILGGSTLSMESDLYNRPDKAPNPVRNWKKFGYLCEKYEDEGRIDKVKDHPEWNIKAWKDAGYSE